MMNSKIIVLALLSAVVSTTTAQTYNVACGFGLKAQVSSCSAAEESIIEHACRDGLGDTGLVTLASLSAWKMKDPQGEEIGTDEDYHYGNSDNNDGNSGQGIGVVQSRTFQAEPVDKVEGGFRRKLAESYLRQRRLCANYNECQWWAQYCAWCSCCSGRRRGLQVKLDGQQARNLQNIENAFRKNVKDRLAASTTIQCVDSDKVDVVLQETEAV